jgi:hypothetical protein
MLSVEKERLRRWRAGKEDERDRGGMWHDLLPQSLSCSPLDARFPRGIGVNFLAN